MQQFSELTSDDFVAGVQGLLPTGRAWPRDPTATQAKFFGGIADDLFALHQAEVLLLDVESEPSEAVQLLPEWETDYGLPDPCTPAAATLTQRRAALLTKITTLGGQSAAYYISVAAALGYAVTITTWRAFDGWSSPWDPVTDARWRFAWQVNAPAITVDWFIGWSSPWDPMWAISDTELDCRLGSIAPAYSKLWIQYGP